MQQPAIHVAGMLQQTSTLHLPTLHNASEHPTMLRVFLNPTNQMICTILYFSYGILVLFLFRRSAIVHIAGDPKLATVTISLQLLATVGHGIDAYILWHRRLSRIEDDTLPVVGRALASILACVYVVMVARVIAWLVDLQGKFGLIHHLFTALYLISGFVDIFFCLLIGVSMTKW